MSHAAGARRLREDELEPTYRPAPRLRLVEGEAAPVRRTITITGQPSPAPRRRPSPAAQKIASRPDRVALWAVLLGLFLVVMAAATAAI